jgi:hypothetical protein
MAINGPTTASSILASRPNGAGLPKRKFAAQWLRDCLEPGSQTQGSIPRLTRGQDAQINYLSTLSIFMKQTTYLATLPPAGSRL